MMPCSRATALAALIVSMAMVDVGDAAVAFLAAAGKLSNITDTPTPMPFNSTVATNLTTIGNVTTTPIIGNQTLSTLAPKANNIILARRKRQITKATESPAPFNQTVASNLTTIGNVSTTLSNVTISNITLTPIIANQTLSTLAPRPKRQLTNATESPAPFNQTVASNLTTIGNVSTPLANNTSFNLTTPIIVNQTFSTLAPRPKRQLTEATGSPAPFNQTVASNLTTIGNATQPTFPSGNITLAPLVTPTTAGSNVTIIGNITTTPANVTMPIMLAGGARRKRQDAETSLPPVSLSTIIISTTSALLPESSPALVPEGGSSAAPISTVVRSEAPVAPVSTVAATGLVTGASTVEHALETSSAAGKGETAAPTLPSGTTVLVSEPASVSEIGVESTTAAGLFTGVSLETSSAADKFETTAPHAESSLLTTVHGLLSTVLSTLAGETTPLPPVMGSTPAIEVSPSATEIHSTMESVTGAHPTPSMLATESTLGPVESTTPLASTISEHHESTLAAITTSAAESIDQSGTEPSIVIIRERTRVPIDVFDCSSHDVGNFGNPKEKCDKKFYMCVAPDALAYEQPCPARLYWDDELRVCASWIHIPACSGKERPTSAPTEAPVVGTTVAPVIDCSNRTEGNYPDPIGTIKPGCSNRFYACLENRAIEMRCPFGLIFDLERKACNHQSRVFACTGEHVTDIVYTNPPPLTWAPVPFDCIGHRNGYYAVNCSNVFYSCNQQKARRLECPVGLVFDEEVQACEIPADVFACTGIRKTTKVTLAPTTAPTIITTPSPLNCMGKPDGIYPDPRDKCSRSFYYCAHNESVHWLCPANLYYDAESRQCLLWLNVFDCSGIHPTTAVKTTPSPPPTFPAVDFDCSHLEDGNYVNPKDKCSQFFYVCTNSDAFRQDCAAGLYYDVTLNMCLSWIYVFACSGQTMPPTTQPPIYTEGTTQKPLYDCSAKTDGDYEDPANACSHIYYQCSSGYDYQKRCADGLYFDVKTGRCEIFDNVFACSGKTLAPETSTIPTPKPTVPVLPIVCTFLDDGDYADPEKNCSNTYYTCSGGYALKRDCPAGLYFDADIDQCGRYWNIPECSGRPRPTTTAGPVTLEPPTVPSFPFDCTKLLDGNYQADDCNQHYWTCNGGLTRQRDCGLGLVYDTEFNTCEYPYLVPKCGGHRITKAPILPSTSPEPLEFDCSRRPNGNYVDPKAVDNCSNIFYVCGDGQTTRLACQENTFYDPIQNACDYRENVIACGGKIIETTVSIPNELTTPSVASTIKETGSIGTEHLTTVESKTTQLVTEAKVESTVAPTTAASEPPHPSPTVPAESPMTPTIADLGTAGTTINAIVTNPIFTDKPAVETTTHTELPSQTSTGSS